MHEKSFDNLVDHFKSKYHDNKCCKKQSLQSIKIRNVLDVRKYVNSKYELAKINLIHGKTDLINHMIFELFNEKTRNYL